MIRQTHPAIATLNDLANRGAHRPVVKTLSSRPRQYEAQCACGWKSTVRNFYTEMLRHAEATLPALATTKSETGAEHRDAPTTTSAANGVRAAGGLTANSHSREQIGGTMPDVRTNTDFRDRYRELEARMKALAEADGDVFLPNLEPAGPVEYVFICMEPSLGRWAGSAYEAKAKVEAGFPDIHPFTLHFCIRQYLCGPTERYYITDLSKGAMLVGHAKADRTRRYDRWYRLLFEELELVARPGAHIFAVGRDVENYLRGRKFARWASSSVLHYSDQAVVHRKAAVVGHEEEFEQFRRSVSFENVLAKWQDVLNEWVPKTFHDEELSRVARMRQLSESDLQLLFTYKRAFETARQQAASAAIFEVGGRSAETP
jgi:hypothetical protein